MSTLTSSLDSETFFASTTSISETQIEQSNLIVNQQIECQHTSRTIGNNHLGLSVAIVERSADLKLAARYILDARLFSDGTSPYAPDLIVVNEWIMDDFRATCSRYARSLKVTSKSLPKETSELVASMEKQGQVHTDIPGLAIFEIKDR
jgi:hypothetical protein